MTVKPVIDTPTKRIVFSFPEDGDVPPYRDAVEVPLDATAASINGQIDARYKAHREVILNPPKPEPVSERSAVEQARDAIRSAMAALNVAEDALTHAADAGAVDAVEAEPAVRVR